jgi:acyl-CoA reductase-like NAD-dependent aldehyde dehydrogenase
MVAEKEQFSTAVAPETLAAFRLIAKAEGHDFETALEDAMREYVAAWERNHPGVRPEAMAHYRDSVERNRKLMELLAQAEQRK